MRKEERFNDILNECLDRILKGETVEQCLLTYPELAKELEPLLRTAKAARVIASIQPRPQFKAESRRQFQTALIEMKVRQNESKARKEPHWQWSWRSGWAIALVVVVIVVLGGGSTVAAANGSMPGDSLYSVKLAVEQVQLSITPGEMAKTKLNAKFADRRTEEIIYVAEKGDAQEVQIVASRLNTNLANITELAAGNMQPGAESKSKTAPLMSTQTAGSLENAQQPVMGVGSAPPPEAKPRPTAVPAPAFNAPPPPMGAGAQPPSEGRPPAPAPNPQPPLLGAAPPPPPEGNPRPMAAPPPAVDSRSAAASAGDPVAAPSKNIGALPATTSAPVEKSQINDKAAEGPAQKYETLRKLIQENYEKRNQKLEEVLKNASPQVRPAIRQTIAQSNLEYDRTIKNLDENEKAENIRNTSKSQPAPDSKNTPDRRSNRN